MRRGEILLSFPLRQRMLRVDPGSAFFSLNVPPISIPESLMFRYFILRPSTGELQNQLHCLPAFLFASKCWELTPGFSVSVGSLYPISVMQNCPLSFGYPISKLQHQPHCLPAFLYASECWEKIVLSAVLLGFPKRSFRHIRLESTSCIFCASFSSWLFSFLQKSLISFAPIPANISPEPLRTDRNIHQDMLVFFNRYKYWMLTVLR